MAVEVSAATPAEVSAAVPAKVSAVAVEVLAAVDVLADLFFAELDPLDFEVQKLNLLAFKSVALFLRF